MHQRRKRICLIGPSKQFFSGPAIRTIYLSNALSHNNDVSALLFKDIMPKFLYPGSQHVGKDIFDIDLNPEIVAYDGLRYCSPISWYRGYRFLQKLNPDVVIMLWWTATVAHMELLMKAIVRYKLKCRLIMEMHEVTDPFEGSILPIRIYSRLASRRLLKGIDAYVTLSDYDRDTFSQAFHIDKNNVTVIPLSLYDHYGKPLDNSEAKNRLGIEEQFVIGYFGLIREYKGVKVLIEAFDLMPYDVVKECRLLIAGEIWEDEAALRNQIKGSRYEGQITLVPRYIADSEIPAYISSMDVIVLPYLRPVSSGIVQIAMAYGKPVIISDFESFTETMAGYEGARFVPPGDAKKIADKLIESYNNFKAHGEVRHTPPSYGWDNIAKQYGELFERITDTGDAE